MATRDRLTIRHTCSCGEQIAINTYDHPTKEEISKLHPSMADRHEPLELLLVDEMVATQLVDIHKQGCQGTVQRTSETKKVEV